MFLFFIIKSHHLKLSINNNNKEGNVLTRKRSYLMGNNVEPVKYLF